MNAVTKQNHDYHIGTLDQTLASIKQEIKLTGILGSRPPFYYLLRM